MKSVRKRPIRLKEREKHRNDHEGVVVKNKGKEVVLLGQSEEE